MSIWLFIPRTFLSLSHLSKTASKDVNAFNTRAIGHKIEIELKKLPRFGLGFTLTSRDTQTSSPEVQMPVYVKNILTEGSAIVDGRLLVRSSFL